MTETQSITVSKFTRITQIPYIIEEIITLLQSSINKDEEIGISWKTLMTFKKVEDVKRELRKVVG